MKAACYVRVSSDEQAREGYSIPAQIKALREYCKKSGVTIHDFYIDEGEPGSKENRPQFQRMLKDAGKKLFGIILVHKFDRFARKVELSQRVKNGLRQSGINIVSITEPIEDSPIGFFQEGMMELLAEYYIKNLSQEVKKGQKEKISQGKACNLLPYGYKNVKGDAVVIDGQAAVVRKIYELYNNGFGSQQISNYLNNRGIPTQQNGVWNTSQINRILRNNAYIGVLKWAGESYPGKLPLIIDEHLFAITQAKIGIKLKSNRTAYYNEFLLLGLLRCGHCGAPMRISKMFSNGNKNGKAYFMYTCRQARYYNKRCKYTRNFQHDKIESDVIEYIEDILKGVREIDSFVDTGTEISYGRIQKIYSELERVKKAYLAEVFTLEEYKDEKERLENELRLLSDDLTIEAKKKKMTKKLEAAYEKFKNAKSTQEKKTILSEIIASIKVTNDALVLDFMV